MNDDYLRIREIHSISFQFLKYWKEFCIFAGNFKISVAEVITVKDLQERFGITATTAKTDVNGLLSMSILNEISFNKVKKGYVKGDKFDEIVNFQ